MKFSLFRSLFAPGSIGCEAPPATRARTRSAMLAWYQLLLIAPLLLLSQAGVSAADLPALWAERIKSVVAVEFYVESETERRRWP
jgi:hypothetical protein